MYSADGDQTCRPSRTIAGAENQPQNGGAGDRRQIPKSFRSSGSRFPEVKEILNLESLNKNAEGLGEATDGGAKRGRAGSGERNRV